MEQNEDLAGLRAGVSLAKAGVSKKKVMTNNYCPNRQKAK